MLSKNQLTLLKKELEEVLDKSDLSAVSKILKRYTNDSSVNDAAAGTSNRNIKECLTKIKPEVSEATKERSKRSVYVRTAEDSTKGEGIRPRKLGE